MAQRPVRFLIKQTSIVGRVPSGTTGNENNLIKQGELAVNTTDQKLYSFDGVNVFEIGSKSFLQLSGGTVGSINVTGDSIFTGSLSASTLFSGLTDLDSVIRTIALESELNDITRIGNGVNTFTGGTDQFPTVNITGGTFDSIFVTGTSELSIISAVTISGGTIFSGNTNLYEIFSITGHTHEISDVFNLQESLDSKANLSGATYTGLVLAPSISATTLSGGTMFSGSTDLDSVMRSIANESELNDITRVGNGINTITGGTDQLPTVNLVDSPSINGITISGTGVANSFEATTLSGGTIFSGVTNLDSVIRTIANETESDDITRVQGGINVSTGGTANAPIINLDDDIDLGSVNATTLSGGTMFSGSTDLDSVMRTIASESELNDITRVGNGVNIITGGTDQLPTINLVDSPSIDGITISGAGTANSFEAIILSGGTIFSGSTNLDSVIRIIASETESDDITRVQGGVNISTGGTANFPIINLDDDIDLGSVNATTLSGGTMFSGSTDLDSVIRTIAFESELNDITRVGNGTNTITGGTDQLPTINLVDSPSIDGITISGDGLANAFSATTLSGGTIFSGSTNLETIITDIASAAGDKTRVQGGVNISTGGTANVPIINLEDDIDLGSVNATTLSGGTMFSGVTNLDSVIRTIANESELNDITRVGNGINTITGGTDQLPTINLVDSPSIDGITISGAGTANSFEATTLSGGTMFSGSTDLDSVIRTIASESELNDITRVQGGVNISTGGTANAPIINLDDDIDLGSLNVTTLSGGTMFSGSTDLDSVMRSIASESELNDITRVGNGVNTITGGTDQLPTVNLVDSPSIDGITISGAGTANSFEVTNLSGGTIFSGVTDLDSVIRAIANETEFDDITRVQGGVNISTGGTANAPIVNLDDDINLGSVNATTLSGGTIFSGLTNLDSVIRNITNETELNDITRVGNGVNTFTGGTAQLPTINITGGSLDNLYVSGSNISNSFSATTLSGGTLFSGSTDLEIIMKNVANSSITGATAVTLSSWVSFSGGGFYQDFYHGMNTLDVDVSIYDLGTNRDVLVEDVERLSVDNMRIYNISSGVTLRAVIQKTGGAGFTSGGTGDLIGPIFSNENSIARFDGTTGKVLKNSLIELNDAGSISNIEGVYANSITGNTVSGGTIFSGVTDLDSVIRSLIINSNTYASFSATSLSGGTIFSGVTDLDSVIRNITSDSLPTQVTGRTDMVSPNARYSLDVNTGVDSTTFTTLGFPTIERGNSEIISYNSGGTEFIINRDGTYKIGGDIVVTGTTANYRYTAQLQVLVNGVGVKDILGGYIRASADSFQTFLSIPDIILDLNDTDTIQIQIKKLSSVTGNAVAVPTSSYFTIQQVGGYSVVSTFTGATIGGGGGSGSGDITRVTNGVNTSTGGTVNLPSINLNDDIDLNSVNTINLSGGTIYSGSTDLDSVIRSLSGGEGADTTRMQGGVNISTGGTANVPIINLDDDIDLGSVNATTLSGGTIFSGSTDLDSVIRTITIETESDDITRVQGGVNVSTGGTANVPIINLDDDIDLGSVNAINLSGGTIYSGSTDLGNLIGQTAEAAGTRQYQFSFVGEATSTTGFFVRSSDAGSTSNPAGKAVSSPFDTFANGAIEPFVVPSDATIVGAQITIGGAAVGTATLGPAPEVRISVYSSFYNGRSLLTNMDIPLLDTSGLGIFNNSSGNGFQRASVTGSTFISGGTLLGIEFTNISGSDDSINALRRCMATITTVDL